MEEKGGGPLSVFVDLFLVLLVLAALAASVLYIVGFVNRASHPAVSAALTIEL